MRYLPVYFCVLVVTGTACREAPTAAGVVTLLPEVYTFACERWSPGVPPVRRTALDVLFRPDSAGRAGLADRERLEALGGRIIHVFNVPLVRAELDVARSLKDDTHFL